MREETKRGREGEGGRQEGQEEGRRDRVRGSKREKGEEGLDQKGEGEIGRGREGRRGRRRKVGEEGRAPVC